MEKHTPGPWINTTDGEANFTGIAVINNWLMRIQHSGKLTPEKQDANAKLVAAAPDMLKALQGFIHHDDNVKEEYKSSPSLREQIEKAIKLATG